MRELFAVIVLISVMVASCSHQETSAFGTGIGNEMLLNVPKVLYKSKEEVQDRIGEPDSVYRYFGGLGALADIYYYDRNETEVYFYDDVAREIFIGDPLPLKFDFNFIKYLGIYPKVAPDYVIDSVVISWGNIPDYGEVKMFTQTLDEEKDLFEYEIHILGKRKNISKQINQPL